MNKNIWIAIFVTIIAVIVFLIWTLWSAGVVLATVNQSPTFNYCHNNNGVKTTMQLTVAQAIGHLQHGHQVTLGTCPSPTPTPTPSPTVTPSPTPNPCPETVSLLTFTDNNPCPTPTPEPTVTPSPTPEQPKEEPKRDTPNNATAPTCPDSKPGNVANIFVDTGTPNDGKLEVRWLPDEPKGNKAHIRYSEDKGNWRYSLLNTDNDGKEVIGGLTNGTHYWFEVAQVNGCAVGNWSIPFDPLP